MLTQSINEGEVYNGLRGNVIKSIKDAKAVVLKTDAA